MPSRPEIPKGEDPHFGNLGWGLANLGHQKEKFVKNLKPSGYYWSLGVAVARSRVVLRCLLVLRVVPPGVRRRLRCSCFVDRLGSLVFRLGVLLPLCDDLSTLCGSCAEKKEIKAPRAHEISILSRFANLCVSPPLYLGKPLPKKKWSFFYK